MTFALTHNNRGILVLFVGQVKRDEMNNQALNVIVKLPRMLDFI